MVYRLLNVILLPVVFVLIVIWIIIYIPLYLAVWVVQGDKITMNIDTGPEWLLRFNPLKLTKDE
jgi:hypothetical protein